MRHQKIAVLGDGAFGTAIATMLAYNGHHVALWCYNESVYHDITSHRENKQYLPGIQLAHNIQPTTSLSSALDGADMIFEAIPVKYMRSVIKHCTQYVPHNSIWVTLSKGIENKTLLLPTEIVTDCIPDALCTQIAGPSFAQDIAQREPTCASIGAPDKSVASTVMACIQTDYFFLTYTSDRIGIELCSALKNIGALGMGFIVGRGYGDNTQSLFFYRMIAESKKILRAMYAHPETIYEPAGIGDYILSCYGSKSRNLDVGRRFGSNQDLCSIIAETGYIPEGMNTLASLRDIMHKHNINAPLFQALYDIFHDQKSIDIISILTR